MENRQDGAEKLTENERPTLPEGSPLLTTVRPQVMSAFRKRRRSPARRKRARKLYLALAFLIIFVCLSAGLLVLRVRAETEATKKWSYGSGIGLEDSAIVTNGMVYALFTKDMLDTIHVMYALDASSGRVLWSYQCIDLVPFEPIVMNGMVYLFCDDLATRVHTLYALDALSGSVKWTYENGNISPPLVANGIIYINAANGTLEALDARSGSRIWTQQIVNRSIYTPVLSGNSIYVIAEDQNDAESNLYALDAATGHKKWSFQQAKPAFWNSPPVIADGMVLAGSSDGVFYALDAQSGRERWTYQQSSFMRGSFDYFVPTVFNGIVYVNGGYFDGNNYNGMLYALNSRSGSRIWADQDQMIPGTPEVVSDNVYLFSTNGNLYALDARTGHKRWSYFGGTGNLTPEPTVVNSMIYETASDGKLHVLNAVSGHEEWSYETEGFSWLAPAVADGTVYVADGDKLDAIQPPTVIS